MAKAEEMDARVAVAEIPTARERDPATVNAAKATVNPPVTVTPRLRNSKLFSSMRVNMYLDSNHEVGAEEGTAICGIFSVKDTNSSIDGGNVKSL